MDEQTPKTPEGEGTPTPGQGMSTQDQVPETPASTPPAPQTEEEGGTGSGSDTPDPILEVFQEAGITGVESREAAIDKIKGLNSLVGDQTIARQRQIVQALQQSTGLSEEQIISALASGGQTPIAGSQHVVQPGGNDASLERTIRLEADVFVGKTPDAEKVRDRLIQRMRETGKSAAEVWKSDFEPLVSIGKTKGAERLQTTTKAQPASGGSTTDVRGKGPQVSAKDKYKGKTAAEMRADLLKSRPTS